MKRLSVIPPLLAALFIAVSNLSDSTRVRSAPTQQNTTPTPGPSATPDPYDGLTIDDLSQRFYGAGELQVIETMETTAEFTRLLIAYPSDDLTIYGFMNVPTSGGPFPVIVALHGYIDPSAYGTLDYTTRYADDLARAGYLVIHPNLRGYRPSDSGPNAFRVGMAVDVLNLIGIVRQTGGLRGSLQQANPHKIGLWGHSMGGGISLRAITVDPGIQAAVLYGSMSGNEKSNFAKIMEWSGGTRGRSELNTPDEILRQISAVYYLDGVEAAVSIHHGQNDEQVPLEWSLDLCTQLAALGKTVECFTYPGQLHTFSGDGDALFTQRAITFFNTQLRN